MFNWFKKTPKEREKLPSELISEEECMQTDVTIEIGYFLSRYASIVLLINGESKIQIIKDENNIKIIVAKPEEN